MNDRSLERDTVSGEVGAVLADIAVDAARLILPYWRNNASVSRKADDSLVTEADHAAERFILDRIGLAYPGAVVVAEEAAAEGRSPSSLGDRFFLVDPLDGTRAFVAGREGFAVSIGLVQAGRPVAGAIAAPAMGVVWYTLKGAAVRRRFEDSHPALIRVRERPAGGGAALLSHGMDDSQAERMASKYGCSVWQPLDSAVKFGLLAEGRYDVYPRPGRTMEWDTAAGEAILTAAGGRVVDTEGQPLRYGKLDLGFANRGFVALGG